MIKSSALTLTYAWIMEISTEKKLEITLNEFMYPLPIASTMHQHFIGKDMSLLIDTKHPEPIS